MVMRQPARVVCAPAASRSATAIGSSTATSTRVSSRTGRSRVGGPCADQLGEISHGADVSLGAPALGADLGFLDLQAGKCPGLALGVLPRYRPDRGVSSQRSSSH